jgi:hypothetical protein
MSLILARATKEGLLYLPSTVKSGNIIYAGLNTSPGKIVRINGGTMKQTGSCELDAGENMVIGLCSLNGFLYVLLKTNPPRIVKIDEETFEVVDRRTYSDYNAEARDMIGLGNSVYFSVGGSPGILRISAHDLSIIKTAGSYANRIATDGVFIFTTDSRATQTYPNRFNLYEYRISDLVIERVWNSFPTVTTHCAHGHVFLGGYQYTNNYLWAFKCTKYPYGYLSEFGTFSEPYLIGNYMDICSDDEYVYTGSKASPARIYKAEPVTPKIITSTTLNTGENICNRIVHHDGYLYAGLGTSPAKIVKLNAQDLFKETTLTLDSGNDICNVLCVGNQYNVWDFSDDMDNLACWESGGIIGPALGSGYMYIADNSATNTAGALLKGSARDPSTVGPVSFPFTLRIRMKVSANTTFSDLYISDGVNRYVLRCTPISICLFVPDSQDVYSVDNTNWQDYLIVCGANGIGTIYHLIDGLWTQAYIGGFHGSYAYNRVLFFSNPENIATVYIDSVKYAYADYSNLIDRIE